LASVTALAISSYPIAFGHWVGRLRQTEHGKAPQSAKEAKILGEATVAVVDEQQSHGENSLKKS
jgi:hypothetical protein